MIVENLDFHYPPTATDEQILFIQSLIGISFFKIVEED